VFSLPVRYRTETGAPLISVTQALQVAGRINTEWFTAEAAERGSCVHAMTERFDAGVTLTMPDEWRGYIEAYATFMAVVKPVYEASEVKVVSTRLGFAGRIDRVCADLFGQRALLDFKTGAPYPWHARQLAAYNVLKPTGARWACYLRADGKYRLTQYDDPFDHRSFMFDLAAARGTVTIHGDYWTTAA
jgi:hypothetical protein